VRVRKGYFNSFWNAKATNGGESANFADFESLTLKFVVMASPLNDRKKNVILLIYHHILGYYMVKI